MSKKINAFRAPVQAEVEEFERRFREAMRSKVPLLDRITKFLTKRKGKQLRPLFVLLTAKMCGNFNESSYTAASLVELLHTATLIHDDVVDDALERRGFFSVFALWKKKAAVLIGDYLLSKALILAIDNDEFQLLRIISTAVKNMSEGELLQMEKSRKLDISEEDYFKIIEQKTASLIAASCAAGAASVTDDTEMIDKMTSFGQNAGIAFQIRDDILDYTGAAIGKPTGNDIKEKKITLPLIYALRQLSQKEKNTLLKDMKRNKKSKSKVKEIVELVKTKGGIDYSVSKMDEYISAARTILESMPLNPSRTALEKMLLYLAERSY